MPRRQNRQLSVRESGNLREGTAPERKSERGSGGGEMGNGPVVTVIRGRRREDDSRESSRARTDVAKKTSQLSWISRREEHRGCCWVGPKTG